jgi:hypothetical protein
MMDHRYENSIGFSKVVNVVKLVLSGFFRGKEITEAVDVIPLSVNLFCEVFDPLLKLQPVFIGLNIEFPI